MPEQLASRSPAPAAAAVPHRRAGRLLAWSLLSLTVSLLAASVVIGLTGSEDWTRVVGFIPTTIALALVGTLVAARTGNRLGWLFLAAATVTAVSVLADLYAARARPAELPGAAWAGWALTVALGVVPTLLFLIPLLFPDGHPPSPRWRPVVWVAVLAGLVTSVSSAISDVNFTSNFPRLRDPVVLVAPLGTVWNQATSVELFVFVVAALSMIVRFRRSGQEQRSQLKWFMYASAISAGVILVVSDLTNNPLPAFEIFFPVIPAAVGIAIFRYRLYDIDRLISRTLAYAIVTGLLVGVYAGLVLLASQVLLIGSPVAVAAATLVAAALFSPVRHRVQRMVDRRFNRVRYDADQTMAAFAAMLRDAVDLDTVQAGLLEAVNRAVEPAHISVWIPSSRPRPPT
jgi:hypothetical protein